ncbi:MAG: DMT family transporter [Anaerovoracaceae bacterium]
MSNFIKKNAKYIVILAVVASSTSGIFSKYMTGNALVLGFYRQLFALPIFVLPVLMNHRVQLKEIARRDLIWSIISGVFLFVHFASWFTAVKYAEIASAVVFAALHPLVVILITIFIFKDKIGFKPILGIMIALIGGGTIAGFDYQSDGGNIIGDMLALLSAICMGIYFSIGQKVRANVSAAIYVMIVFATSLCCFFISMIVTKTPFVGYPGTDWLAIIGATVFCQIGAHAVWNWSMGYVSSLYVSAWETMEIVFATIFAFIIFGEVPSLAQIIGAIIAIAGLLYYNYHENKRLGSR